MKCLLTSPGSCTHAGSVLDRERNSKLLHCLAKTPAVVYIEIVIGMEGGQYVSRYSKHIRFRLSATYYYITIATCASHVLTKKPEFTLKISKNIYL